MRQSLLIFLFIIIWGSFLYAQDKKIAIISFTGIRSGQFYTIITNRLRNYYTVVSRRKITIAKRQLRIRRVTRPYHYKKIAKKLNISAFIKGRVFKAGRRWFLEIVVINGSDGEILGRRRVAGRNLRKLKLATGSLIRRIRPLIDSSIPPKIERVVSKKERRGVVGLTPEQLQALEEETPWSKPKLTKEKVEVTEKEKVSLKKREPSSYGYLSLYLAINGAYRDFSLPVDSANTNIASVSNISYKSGLFPEFSFGFSFYPAAIFTDSRLSGLGLQFYFSHHIYLRSVIEGTQQEVSTKEYAYYIGTVYRLTLGSINIGAIIYFYFGYGRESFSLGKENNIVMPTFNYDYIKLGVDLYFPFGTHYIGMVIGGGYLGGFSIGEEASRAFSEEGDSPTAHGFEFSLGLKGSLVKGLKWYLGFDLIGFSTSYMGSGQGYDDDPGTYLTAEDSSLDLFWRIIPKLIYVFGWNPS